MRGTWVGGRLAMAGIVRNGHPPRSLAYARDDGLRRSPRPARPQQKRRPRGRRSRKLLCRTDQLFMTLRATIARQAAMSSKASPDNAGIGLTARKDVGSFAAPVLGSSVTPAASFVAFPSLS